MTRIMVTFGFAVAFLAGLIVGVTWRMPAPPPTASAPTTRPDQPQGRGGRGTSSSFLARELGLSDEQQQQMRQIWSETAGRGRQQQGEQRRRLREEREAAIAALIRPEDRAAYDAVLKDYETKQAALEAEWRNAFQNAVQRTKAILTDEQRVRYEQMLKQWEDRDRQRERVGTRPTTRPDDSPPPP